MRKLTILVPAHNEQDVIGDCIESLKSMKSPPDVETNLVVILDRCTDETKQIVRSMGVNFIEKRFRGKYVSAIAEVLSYAIGETDGDIVLKCDADVCEIPSDAIVKLLPHLNRNVKRVSSEVKTRSGKWWLDFIFWLRDLNNKITPLETQPRGAFTLFERKTYEEVGGFDKTKPTWDTALDLRLKCKGYKVKRVKDVFVTEKRNFTVQDLIGHQISSGKARRQLGISFWRTLLHSIFRGRIFVLWGYLRGAE